MELRIGKKDPLTREVPLGIEDTFFVVVTRDAIYMWEDMSEYSEEGEIPVKWCKWPKKWLPVRENHPCSRLTFLLMTGYDFDETVKRDIPQE